MPAKLDLSGRTFGRLVVIEAGLPVMYGRLQPSWVVRCECGRVERHPQPRLTQSKRGKPALRACRACGSPPCVICSGPMPDRTHGKVTCGPVCARTHARELTRASYRRVAADAERVARRREVARARVAERRVSDPTYLEQLGEWRAAHQERMRGDPAFREHVNGRHRVAYSKRADREAIKRKAKVESLTPDELAARMDANRDRARERARLRRERLRADPEAYAAYLAERREAKRRRALAELASQASALFGRTDDR